MRQERGAAQTPRPGDAGDGLVQPWACQGSCIWQDDASSLPMATGAWGWLVGVRACRVARSHPRKVRGAGVQLYWAVLARGTGVASIHLPAAVRKPAVKSRRSNPA